MSDERSLSSSAKPRMEHGNVDGVGVGADGTGAANLRAGATLMKSVSIFLMNGRKASVNSKRLTSGSPKHEPRKRHRRRMLDSGNARNSVHIVKLIDSLKKKTRFSWQVRDYVLTVSSLLRSFYL